MALVEDPSASRRRPRLDLLRELVTSVVDLAFRRSGQHLQHGHELNGNCRFLTCQLQSLKSLSSAGTLSDGSSRCLQLFWITVTFDMNHFGILVDRGTDVPSGISGSTCHGNRPCLFNSPRRHHQHSCRTPILANTCTDRVLGMPTRGQAVPACRSQK